jgi:molybdate transport repressor ModE-like protein
MANQASGQINWVGLEVRHIAALEAIAREGSFRRAAERLGYVQSAISQQIAALERVVGRRVVERRPGGGRVELTAAGELVLVHGRVVLARLKAAQADVAALNDEEGSQRLRVGLTQSTGLRILPRLLPRFLRAWPHVRVVPVESTPEGSAYAALERGRLDLAFADLPTPMGPFEALQLMSNPYVAVARCDSPLASKVRVTLHDLAAQPLVGHSACEGLDRVETQLRARGIEPTVVVRVEVNATVQALARAGVGVAVLPALAVDVDDRRVVVRELEGLPARLLGLVRHRERRYSDPERDFAAIARAVCTEQSNQGLLAVASA